MIKPINNNINFKGFYSLKNTNFSESQKRVIENIKTTLGNKIDNGDYLVTPGAIKDSVELTHIVTGYKFHGNGLDETVSFHRGADKFIGTYNEEYPFKIEDLSVNRWGDKPRKSDNTWKYVGWTIIALGAMLIGNGALKKCSSSIKEAPVEKITTHIKDSITTATKDSLKLFV